MFLDRQQQIGEAAGDARPNRLALHGAREAQHRDLVDGHREVVGPELREALEEWPLGGRPNARSARTTSSMYTGR